MDVQILNQILFALICTVAVVLCTAIAMRRFIKREYCTHKNNFIYVENVAATCEKTTTTCMDCGKKTTKTDC